MSVNSQFSISWVVPPSVFILIIIWFYCVYIPLLIWYLKQFLNYKRLIYISKRHPIVTKYEIIAVIFVIGFNFTNITFYRCISSNNTLYEILWNIAIFSQPITIYAAFYCLLWRCWHFYYDAKLILHLESEWKNIINPSFKLKEKSWFLSNKLSFGSTKFIGKRLFFMYIISCFISISIWFIDDIIGYTAAALTDFFIFSVPYTLFFILYRKTPKFGDELYISSEMKRVNIVLICSLLLYLVIITLSGLLIVHENIFAISICVSCATLLFFACLYHTKWVLSHIEKWMDDSLKSLQTSPKLELMPSKLVSFMEDANNNNNYKIHRKRTMSHTQSPTSNTSVHRKRTLSSASSMNSKLSNDPLHKKNVMEVLENKATFNAFIQHLNAEYSLECMLSFIEMMQFQSYLRRNRDKLHKVKIHRKATKDTAEDDDIDVVYDKEIEEGNNKNNDGIIVYNDHHEFQDQHILLVEFKDYVPKSAIVYGDDSGNNDEEEVNIMIAKQKAYRLYSKYIAECSKYELNLSYPLRARFMDIMQDYDLWINTKNDNNNIDDIIGNIDGDKLGILFNMVIIEMLQLLEFSFSRFKSILKENAKCKQ